MPEYISELLTSVATIPGRSTHRVATSSCRRHVDELATEHFLLLHCEHGTGYRRSWNCCDRRTRFIMIWKHFCFILSTGTRIRIDSVMRRRSSSSGRNTSALVTGRVLDAGRGHNMVVRQFSPTLRSDWSQTVSWHHCMFVAYLQCLMLSFINCLTSFLRMCRLWWAVCKWTSKVSSQWGSCSHVCSGTPALCCFHHSSSSSFYLFIKKQFHKNMTTDNTRTGPTSLA